MENPDLVLQETGSRATYSRLNYVPSGDTLRRDAISSYILDPRAIPKSARLDFLPAETVAAVSPSLSVLCFV